MHTVLRSGPLHVVSPRAEDSGARYAITVFEQAPRGGIAWSGLLSPAAIGKPAEAIQLHDYMERQTASFASWFALWWHFEQLPHLEPLVAEIRRMVQLRTDARHHYAP